MSFDEINVLPGKTNSRLSTIFNRHSFISSIRAGLYHMQPMQLHRAARKKGVKLGAPKTAVGRQNLRKKCSQKSFKNF